VPEPDFPTRGEVLNRQWCAGHLSQRPAQHPDARPWPIIEEIQPARGRPTRRGAVVITELPLSAQQRRGWDREAGRSVNDGKDRRNADIRDESTRDGMRVVGGGAPDGDPRKCWASCSAAPPCRAISARFLLPLVDGQPRPAQPCASLLQPFWSKSGAQRSFAAPARAQAQPKTASSVRRLDPGAGISCLR